MNARNPPLRSHIKEVAFGSLLHMVQDSFAKAHVDRAEAIQGQMCEGVVPYLLVTDSKQISDPAYQKLKDSEGAISGRTRTGIGWADALRVRLQHRLDRFWLLIEPAIWLDHAPEAGPRHHHVPFHSPVVGVVEPLARVWLRRGVQQAPDQRRTRD